MNQNKLKSHALINTFLFGLLASLFFSGCTTFPNDMFRNQNIIPDQATGEITGQYDVQISGILGKPSLFEGDIDGPITVQDVIERSGVHKKFRAMNVMLVRRVEGSGQELKLPVTYQVRSKSVMPEQDYAIHDNDVIVIQARTNNPLDKLVESISPVMANN